MFNHFIKHINNFYIIFIINLRKVPKLSIFIVSLKNYHFCVLFIVVRSTDRVELVENNEYGYCSLIKATKAVLDKLDVENTTFAKITPKERIEKILWDKVAIRGGN